MSASVMANASMNGWYIAAFLCRSTMGRCPYRVGISESGTKVVNRTARKRIPPREKNADVLSGSLTNTVPMITAMIKKELEIISNRSRPQEKVNLHNLRCLRRYASPQNLEASDDDCPGLHRDRYDVGASFSRSLGMLLLYLPRVGFGQISLSNEILAIRIHVLFVDSGDVTLKKSPCEIIRGSRCSILESSTNVTSVGVCDSDQEVGGCLTVSGFKPEIDEVLAGEI